MHGHRFTLAFLLSSVLLVAHGNSQSPPALTQDQKTKLKERDRLIQEFQQHAKQNKIKEAIDSFMKVSQIHKEVFGVDHPFVDSSLTGLARYCEDVGAFSTAKQIREELIERKAIKYGKNNWRSADARWDLTNLDILQKLSGADRLRLHQAAQTNREAIRLQQQGKFVDAMAQFESSLLTRKQLLGEKHVDYATSLNNLAALYDSQNQYDKAEPLYLKALVIIKEVLGEKHPNYAQILHNLATEYKVQSQYAKAVPLFQKTLEIRKETFGEKHPDYAISLNALAVVYESLGQYAKAEPFFLKALAIRREIFGERHPDYATSLNNLAGIYTSQAQYAKAESFYQKALEIRKEVLGERDVDYADSLNDLASMFNLQGQNAKAESLVLKALDIRKEVLGEKHRDYAASLNNLATILESRGQYAQAEPLFLKALDIHKALLGEKHAIYAANVNNLAELYARQGQYTKAEPLFLKALSIHKEVLGDKHPGYAVSLNNLAMLYTSHSQYAKAEPLLREALDIRQQVLGEKHPDTAISLNNLAAVYESQGQQAKAEPLYIKALAITKDILGEKHPNYAASLNNLASLYLSLGEPAKAEKLLHTALAVLKGSLGEKHPRYAASLNNLATHYVGQRQYTKSEPLLLQAIQIDRALLHLSASSQTEQQQQMHALHLRSHIDNLCLASSQQTSGHHLVYTEILAWKGAVTARQRQTRQIRTILQQNPDAETKKLLGDLDTVSGQLAALSLSQPDPKQIADLPERLKALSDRREELEKNLSRKTEAFRRLRETRQLTPNELQKRLPVGTVLVDFFEYRSHDGKDQTPTLVAFVITANAIERIELGTIEPLAEAIDRFRARLQRSANVSEKDDPAPFLREKLWQPLEKHLTGAQMVLISPDGPLHRLPFAALPGKDPKNYLLEETALVVLPVPQLLLELLEPQPVPATAKLLALGDVDFDAEPGVTKRAENVASLTRAGSGLNWSKLPGTEKEVTAIEKSFRDARSLGTVELLRGDKATETAVRSKVEGCHYLHLATHGFFAPKELKSMTASRGTRYVGKENDVVGYHPGTMSGLVLAGANRPKENDDGVLTALEVGDLNLTKVDLAVLSACETGLGEVAGGEGVLGLQRAFQVAGAKSVITTLWQIPDEPTRVLMERFYENLWKGRDGKKFSKIEALREAQLWMLKEGKAHPGIARGLVRDDVPPLTKDGRLPPYYWAAFVLSGDWR